MEDLSIVLFQFCVPWCIAATMTVSRSGETSCISAMIFMKKEEFLVMECRTLIAVTIEIMTFDTVYVSLL